MDIDLDNVDVEPEAPRPTGNPATEKQINFIARLVKERETEPLEAQIDRARTAVMARTLSTREASDLIGALLDAPRLAVEDDITEGLYRSAGTIYKVQRAVHGSGNLYAKVLVETHEGRCGGHMEQGPSGFDAPLEYCNEQATCAQWVAGEWEFQYAPGALRRINPADRMTLEQAQEWGRLYGTCARCGRTLTDEDSIARGLGPICAGAEW